ncbi:MAG: hypothetical protein GXY08_13490 [Ruminococcus sp.]|nr:hypothetical protein [Ruminococcus sp.]
MKNSFKKFAAAISAAAICTASAMSTAMNVTAATNQKHTTYRTYFYYDKSASTSSRFHELQLEYYSYNSCPVVAPGSQGVARTSDPDAIYDFSWYIAGSGSQYGSIGYFDITYNKNTAPQRSGMICKIVSEAYDTTQHSLEWGIGNECNMNKNARIEYKYKIKDRNGNLITKSQYSDYYSKMYADIDADVCIDDDICVKALTVMIGDINDDDVVDDADQRYLTRYLNGTEDIPYHCKQLNNKSACFYAADMNGDGYVNYTDLDILDRYLAGTQRLVDCQYS